MNDTRNVDQILNEWSVNEGMPTMSALDEEWADIIDIEMDRALRKLKQKFGFRGSLGPSRLEALQTSGAALHCDDGFGFRLIDDDKAVHQMTVLYYIPGNRYSGHKGHTLSVEMNDGKSDRFEFKDGSDLRKKLSRTLKTIVD